MRLRTARVHGLHVATVTDLVLMLHSKEWRGVAGRIVIVQPVIMLWHFVDRQRMLCLTASATRRIGIVSAEQETPADTLPSAAE